VHVLCCVVLRCVVQLELIPEFGNSPFFCPPSPSCMFALIRSDIIDTLDYGWVGVGMDRMDWMPLNVQFKLTVIHSTELRGL
jgi:hypothetical protein